MRNDRREFLKNITKASAGIAASLAMPINLFAKNGQEEKLVILHTNDMHSKLESFPEDGSRNAGLGGVAAKAALIQKIRSANEHVLLLDAGDIFQSSPYFDKFKGEPELKAMSLMHYDAATLGEHEFDAGIDNLSKQLSNANFPFVNCNYDFANTPLQGKILPYKIFNKGKLKIGVTGVGIDLKDLQPPDFYGNIIYHNPIIKANETAAYLKNQGCDLIICLSHLGDRYNDDKISDEILAKECYDIDLIIGGHTHKFFYEPRKFFNRKGGHTLVNQAGWGGLQLGKLDYMIDLKKDKKDWKVHTVFQLIKTSN